MKNVLIVIFLTAFSQICCSQDLFIEGGIGIGNIVGSQHRLGKSEIHFNIIKSFNFGKLGLDFSFGGNFIPLSDTDDELGISMISSNDSRFNSIALLYRLPIKKHFFIEPRVGYASLNAFVHTDDKTQIKESNLTAGIGLGGKLAKFTLSIRYQYFGKTQDYEGFISASNLVVRSTAEPVSMVLLRASYRFKIK
jgi:hypothetical protein